MSWSGVNITTLNDPIINNNKIAFQQTKIRQQDFKQRCITFNFPKQWIRNLFQDENKTKKMH